MGKQAKANRSGSPSSHTLGKGKVTPKQIAFIVDRYLCDNSFSKTRSVFRNEASAFIPNSPAQEAPRNLLSLEAILDEYICLKEQKVMVEQDMARLDFEKRRVNNLLHSMQGVLNAYNSATPAAPVAPVAAVTALPLGHPAHVSLGVLPASTPSNTSLKQVNVSSPISTGPSTRKRPVPHVVFQALPDSKRSCSMSSSKRTQSSGCLPEVAVSGPLVQGSSVAKSLSNQPVSTPPSSLLAPLPTCSTATNTPTRIISPQEEKSLSPQGFTPTNCTVITSQRVTVSPCKNLGYYTVERNQCIATSSPVKTTFTKFSKRDCVKSRLDFDASDVTCVPAKPSTTEDASTSGTDKDSDPFDIDFPNLDIFGPNFPFAELLVDLDLGDDIGFTCQQNLPDSVDNASGSSPGCSDENPSSEHIASEFLPSHCVISEKYAIVQGMD